MDYKVTLSNYVALSAGNAQYMAIPGTAQEVVLSTDRGPGRAIWWGYLNMRESQKKTTVMEAMRVTCSEEDPEIKKFEEAINLFFLFQAGYGRDNYLRVERIMPATEAMNEEAKHA